MTETIRLDDLMALIEEQITDAALEARSCRRKARKGMSPDGVRHYYEDARLWDIRAIALRDLRALILTKVAQEKVEREETVGAMTLGPLGDSSVVMVRGWDAEKGGYLIPQSEEQEEGTP